MHWETNKKNCVTHFIVIFTFFIVMVWNQTGNIFKVYLYTEISFLLQFILKEKKIILMLSSSTCQNKSDAIDLRYVKLQQYNDPSYIYINNFEKTIFKTIKIQAWKSRVKEYFLVTFACISSLKSAYEGRWPFSTCI